MLPETEVRPNGDTLPASRLLQPDFVASEALAPGSRLDEFEIVRVLGAGGFGIVYLALDTVLLRNVAIKEFIPTALAARTSHGTVAVRSPEDSNSFEIGLHSFYNEGRLLARFDNASLARVFRFWTANGTAYMAMQHYPGQTLRQARRAMPAAPDEAWLRLFFDRLLGALETLHSQGVYHRDIAPDNIMLLPDGQPVILDFGSARRVIGDRTQSLTAILKPNYSPVEQYADGAGVRQGGYTDLYALGGTVYFMITGKEPMPAVMRAVGDSFPVLAKSMAEGPSPLSHQFLAALDWTLGVAPDDRPQTVAELRAALRGELEPPPPSERSGVLIADQNQPYDGARAMLKTELAEARPVVLSTRTTRVEAMPAATPEVARQEGPRRPAWLLASGLASIMVGAPLLWALLGAPSRSSAEPPAATARVTASASASASASAKPESAVRSPPVTVGPATPSTPPASSSSAGPSRNVPRDPPRANQPADAAPNARARSTTPAQAPPRGAASAPSPAGAPDRKLVRGAGAPSMPFALCADMNLISRTACLSQACGKPPWSVHPKCVDARRLDEQRQRRMEQ